MTSLIIDLVLVAGALYCLGSLVNVVRAVKKELIDIISEFKLERELLKLQREILANQQLQMALQNAMMETRINMAMNSIHIMKMMTERMQDPKWMEKFDEGRSNAKYN